MSENLKMKIEIENLRVKFLKNDKDSKEITFSKKLKGYFLLTRPTQLIWLDVFVSLAIYAVIAQHFPKAHYLLFIITAVLADAGACTINDLGDLESDSKSTEPSRRLRPLPTGVISKNASKKQTIILSGIGLAIALYLDVFVFIFALILVLLSYQYSMKPFKMNAKPVISNLFWVAFGFLYYLAVTAYLIRYENIPWENVYNGIYFLITMILFASIAETLAKDLRDLENDRAGGRNTTPVYFGPKKAVVVSFIFSLTGLIAWATPFFTFYETHLISRILIILILILWNSLCFHLCRLIYIRYKKDDARRLHQGYILTFTYVLALTFFIAVT